MSPTLPKMMKAAVLAGLAVVMAAPALGQAKAAGGGSAVSKIDFYGGYGAWDPRSRINSGPWDDPLIYSPNATVSLSYYFFHNLGLQVEGGYFAQAPSVLTSTTPFVCSTNPCNVNGVKVYTAEAGPVYRYPLGRFIPFVHVLGGEAKISGPESQKLTWGLGLTGGIGVDYVLPFFHNRFSIRPIQLDFQYSDVNYGTLSPDGLTGGEEKIDAVKATGGIVFRFGSSEFEGKGHKAHDALMLACDAEPSSINPGEPIEVSARPMNLKKNASKSYSWTTTGGRLTSSQGNASISTLDLAPGQYVVTGTLKQGKAVAKCDANFTVKGNEPPTISCSATPSSVTAGSTATISANANSPSNRTLTYSYTSDAGQVVGSGASVMLNTTGVTQPTVNVTCTVTDDAGKTAQALTQVAVSAPAAVVMAPVQATTPNAMPTTAPTGAMPSTVQAGSAAPPPMATYQELCGVSFERDRKRPTRVDNEAKACLDDIALTLQRQTDAKLVIVGNYSAGETATEGARRSLNVSQYLTDEKGIDVGRIQVRYGVNSGRAVTDVLVPAGASYDDPKTTAFEPSSVKRVGQAYGKPGQYHGTTVHRKRRKKPAAALTGPVAPPA